MLGLRQAMLELNDEFSPGFSMMSFHQDWIFQWMKQYAYQPLMVYGGIVFMMIASGFGLPVPEEVTIVSVGLLSYMGAHPDLFPPPEVGTRPMNGYEAAVVTLVSVVAADLLVFTLGRTFGRKIVRSERFHEMFADKVMSRINTFTKKYGVYAAFVFRFTPGIRFPAHIAMGMSEHLPMWQFFLVDGSAATISVPTQILLIYHYGETILTLIHRFKMMILAVLAGVLFIWVLRKLFLRVMRPTKADSSQ
ncbi:MAG: DedA family protein [Bdellovibrio sp.]|nr:MAG: DedA family protein [Bdellovibrio sp.]